MQVVIIGAGIVGLHAARVAREGGHDVWVLEKERFLGEHTSGRNTGVIHAGIFYKPGSLKEKTCIEGNRLTYEWLGRLKVPHVACGKWVVPIPSGLGQEGDLEPFFEKISRLPIPTPLLKSADEVKREEPRLRKTQALFIPSTGVMDAASYLNHLSSYLEGRGVQIILDCQVTGQDHGALKTTKGDIHYDIAINCAGLFSDKIAHMFGITGYEIRPCRGDYYLLQGEFLRHPVYHLPPPQGQGLGVHLTPTLDHQTLIGPNAFFIEEKEDYHHHTDDMKPFKETIDYDLPAVVNPRLVKAYSGNRPKLFFKGEPCDDFTIIQKDDSIHFLGIESPGLTAAPALAQYITGIKNKRC